MKAFLSHQYGGPDVLAYEEIEKPTPKSNEVLVRIKAISINPKDWHLYRGSPYFVRLYSGLFRPRFKVFGSDVAGTVEAVGAAVTQFKVGDHVFGDVSDFGAGGFAEFVCADEKAFVPKPENISFEEAAGIPIAGLTAMHALVRDGQIKSGQKVLINGASGGVGTYMVQLAKSLGAEVTTVCSTRNIELVTKLGADHPIDYTKEDFCALDEQFDLILDNIGNRSTKELKRILKPRGKTLIIGFYSNWQLFKLMLITPILSRFSKQKFGPLDWKYKQDDLKKLSQFFAMGEMKTAIDKLYPFKDLPQALRYLEEGHARGKVLIQV